MWGRWAASIAQPPTMRRSVHLKTYCLDSKKEVGHEPHLLSPMFLCHPNGVSRNSGRSAIISIITARMTTRSRYPYSGQSLVLPSAHWYR